MRRKREKKRWMARKSDRSERLESDGEQLIVFWKKWQSIVSWKW